MRKFRKNFCHIQLSNKLKDDFDLMKLFVSNTNTKFDVSNPETLRFMIKDCAKVQLTFAVKEFSIDFPITTPTRINRD